MALQTLNSDVLAKSRKPKTDRLREAGFTLIELLLAVTLMMTVAASCVSVFSMGIQIWKRSQGQSITERKAILFLEKAGEELRNMAAIQSQGELGLAQQALMRESFAYEGTAVSIAFPVLIGPSESNPEKVPGFARARYWFSAGELCHGLESVSDLYLRKEAPCRPVMTDLARAKFEYYVASGISGELGWSESWDGEAAPAAVRIRLELKKDSKSQAPGKVYEKTFLIPVGSA